jgi:hypothetical protein
VFDFIVRFTVNLITWLALTFGLLQQTVVGQTEEYNFTFDSEEWIDTTEYWTPWARCCINRCRYNGVPLYSQVLCFPYFPCIRQFIIWISEVYCVWLYYKVYCTRTSNRLALTDFWLVTTCNFVYSLYESATLISKTFFASKMGAASSTVTLIPMYRATWFHTPCGRLPAEILGSNPTGGMDICLLWVSCVVR